MLKSTLLAAVLSALIAMPLLANQNKDTGDRVVPMLLHEGTDTGSWVTANDTVMGGVSSSSFELTDSGTMIFRGNLSLENNGGFASIRSALKPVDRAGADAFRLRVRGDGHRYQLRFSVRGEWRWVNYGQSFETKAGEWIEVELPVDQFRATWRGEPVSQAPPFDPSSLATVTLMVTDNQEGKFEMEVDWISTVFHGDDETLPQSAP